MNYYVSYASAKDGKQTIGACMIALNEEKNTVFDVEQAIKKNGNFEAVFIINVMPLELSNL